MIGRTLRTLTQRGLSDGPDRRSVTIVGAILFGSIALVGILVYVGHAVILFIAPPPLLGWRSATLLSLCVLVGAAILIAQFGNPTAGGHLLAGGFFAGVAALTIWLGSDSGIILYYLPAIAMAVALFGLRAGTAYAIAVSIACLLTNILERVATGIPVADALPGSPSPLLISFLGASLTTTLLILFTAQKAVRVARKLDLTQAEVLPHQQKQLDSERLEAMERLLAVGKVLNSTLNMEEVLTLILDKLNEVFPYDSACILLLTPPKDTLVVSAAQGYETDLAAESPEMPLGDFGLLRSLIEGGTPIIVEDTFVDPRWAPRSASGHVRSWLGMPMIARDEVIGALSIDRSQPHKFSADEITAAEAFAEQAAAAVQNARLYQSLAKTHGELKKLDSQRAEYYSLVVHDMRTPLTVALGYIEMLLDPSDDETLVESQRFMLNHTRESIERVLIMVNDFMDYSKIEAGFLELESKSIDLVSLIDATVASLLSAAASKGVTLTWEAPSLSLVVRGDRKRLQQVVENLLVNAVKYTAEDGSVEIRIRQEGNLACTEVQDTGIGVPPEVQPLLFDAYRAMASGSLSRAMRGTGLGLFIVRRVVEAHGGSVGVQSTGVPGEGSTFYFTLPLAGAED